MLRRTPAEAPLPPSANRPSQQQPPARSRTVDMCVGPDPDDTSDDEAVGEVTVDDEDENVRSRRALRHPRCRPR